MIESHIKGNIEVSLEKYGDTGRSLRSIPNNPKKSDDVFETFEGLQNVADQFEAIFLETLLRQARDSKLSDGLFDSKADDNFEQMFDQELANSSSKLVDIGIAEAIVRQMSKTRN